MLPERMFLHEVCTLLLSARDPGRRKVLPVMRKETTQPEHRPGCTAGMGWRAYNVPQMPPGNPCRHGFCFLRMVPHEASCKTGSCRAYPCQAVWPGKSLCSRLLQKSHPGRGLVLPVVRETAAGKTKAPTKTPPEGHRDGLQVAGKACKAVCRKEHCRRYTRLLCRQRRGLESIGCLQRRARKCRKPQRGRAECFRQIRRQEYRIKQDALTRAFLPFWARKAKTSPQTCAVTVWGLCAICDFVDVSIFVRSRRCTRVKNIPAASP